MHGNEEQLLVSFSIDIDESVISYISTQEGKMCLAGHGRVDGAPTTLGFIWRRAWGLFSFLSCSSIKLLFKRYNFS